MSHELTETSGRDDIFGRLEQALSIDAIDVNGARVALEDLSRLSNTELCAEAGTFAALLSNLLEISHCVAEQGDGTAEDILDYCRAGVTLLRGAVENGAADVATLDEARQIADDCWGNYLQTTQELGETDNDWPADAWTDNNDATNSEEQDSEAAELMSVDINAVLSSLESLVVEPEEVESWADAEPATEIVDAAASAGDVFGDTHDSSEPPEPPDPEECEIDAELLAAYSDDAGRCLASMEQCLLQLESDATDESTRQQLCRELHTIKGASGSVGLVGLAGYLHALEDYVGACSDTLDIGAVLRGVDAVRDQIRLLSGDVDEAIDSAPSATTQSTESRPDAPKQATPRTAPSGDTDNRSVRIEARRLDRLMDLLAELVTLRNRRDSYVTELRQLHGGLAGCAGRLRGMSEKLTGETTSEDLAFRSREISELSSDIAELNRGLRDVFDPLADDNSAVSRLIAEYRRELIDLQRVPVEKLFRRLHRGVADAARSEGKQVDVRFVGEDVRVERSMQESLFEPLLHIVRNAVSHGIEDAETRVENGKDASGCITIQARSSATALVLEVKDDGKGLDYVALELRGRERGLIPPDKTPSNDRLARLIFHPGFSTKTEVSAVSGRGVGMDVVATQVHRMRGHVDIDSNPGHGTTIRLSIPLRSAVEHAMLVRAGGQLFALPMQSIHAAGPEAGRNLPEGVSPVSLSRLLQLRGHGKVSRQVVLLGDHTQQVAIHVDSVVGAEEVVVRTLPPLLWAHRQFSGVTLSGQGETVLLLDVGGLLATVNAISGRALPEASSAKTVDEPTILVVDDSLSTRLKLVRRLQQAGYATSEASDGIEALKTMRAKQFIAVVTDLDMPRLGGLELLTEIKHGRRLKDIPVIVCTAHEDQKTRDRAFKLGADGFCTKPVTNTVIAKLKEVLNRSMAPAEVESQPVPASAGASVTTI